MSGVVARPPDKCVQRRSVSGGAGTAGATAGRTPTQNAVVGRSGRLNSHRLTRHRQHCLVVSSGRCEFGIILHGVYMRLNRKLQMTARKRKAR